MTPTGEPHPLRMRRVADIDVAGVAEALNDNSADTQWWYDPANGRVEPSIANDFLLDLNGNDDDQRERGLVFVEPSGPRPAYQDMADFAATVGDVRASELLTRAIEGPGAFRRFRDTLDDFDDLRDCWFDFTRAASERRAIDWLVDEHLVERDDTDDERDTRSNTMNAALANVADHHRRVVDEAELVARWDEIIHLINTGNTVTISRNDQAWATITPAARPGQSASI